GFLEPRQVRRRKILTDEGEVRVVGGIVREQIGPPGHHRLDLPLKTRLLFWRVLDPTRRGFVVVELGERRPDIAIAGTQELAAEVDVVEGDGKRGLVQSTDFEKTILPDEQAGAGDSAVVLHQAQSILLPLVVARKLLERMP